MASSDLKGKKVLVMGLGALGGGVATTKWLVSHGAAVTVTDLRSRKELTLSLKVLGSSAKKIRLALGAHRETDFKNHDLIVVNPAVPRESRFLKVARNAHREIVNDARIFLDRAPNPVIVVTGTRGKTTTTHWIAHFLHGKGRAAFAAGNTPERPLLADLDRLVRRPETPAVLELSSWQLELVGAARKAPDIAIITNLYPDHLNRYRNMEHYALAKANIFKGQNPAQILIFNAQNSWTRFFLRMKPRGRVYFFSTSALPRGTQGVGIRNGEIVFTEGDMQETVAGKRFVKNFLNVWGSHNLENLLASMLGAYFAGMTWAEIVKRTTTLPSIPYRQEMIVRRKKLLVVNDSAGTSPDATIAALTRFRGPGLHLITGGTDKKLEFRTLAKIMTTTTSAPRVFFLEGSATQKLVAELARLGYFKRATPLIFSSLSDILRAIKSSLRAHPSPSGPFTVLFSPGAASFEKFKNEFDRGNQFSRSAKRLF